MTWQITRALAPLPSLALRALVGGARPDDFHDAYVVTEAGTPRWQALVHWGKHAPVPFREECVWPGAGVVAIGGGATAHFLGTADGEPRGSLDVPDHFGHLALDAGEPGVRAEALYVLGWRHAYAVGPDLRTRWRARDLAVDGIVWRTAKGPKLYLNAEMDPPGGWFEVELEAATGRELTRRPDFLEGYAGIYGSA
ncbi:MAG TPA: hypothetical protein VFS43_39440 [Polyangiaceae bacterium]|nr:hypothetical protein [Polyangiaceae bacterium]